MAWVRILVDGYSLLHHWPALRRGAPPHSAAARNELVRILTQYQDAVCTPVTIFFDGSGAPPHVPKDGTPAVEVLFSSGGRTADDLIERVTHRFQEYGEVLVVTNDHAERDTVSAAGGSAVSCSHFIALVESALRTLRESVREYNRNEQKRYRQS